MKKLALITGGTKGIGKAISEELSSDYDIVTVGRSEGATEQGDLRDINFRNYLVEKYTPDLFINNAASLYKDPVKMSEMNGSIPVELLYKFYDKMPSGCIINISSLSAEVINRPKADIARLSYSVAKRFLKDTSLALNSSKNKPIKVMCLSPAAVHTSMLMQLTGHIPDQSNYTNYDWNESVCWTTTKEIADVVRWLVSLPAWVSVSELVLDNHYSKAIES